MLASTAQAQPVVKGVPTEDATAPVNLQLTPTDAFVRIRGWSLPAPLLPLAILGTWGGKGTITGGGDVHIPADQISNPSQFSFPRDINGEEEQMTISLFKRGDWTGNVNPVTGEGTMNMPTTLKIEASHVRMVDIPWPGGWIYGNIECEVPLDFGPMVTGTMDPPDLSVDPPSITSGTPYDPATGQFSVINNSMTIGGFDCSHPDIGAGQVEDELNGAVNIPSPAGRTDAKFNMTFLEGGAFIRPEAPDQPGTDPGTDPGDPPGTDPGTDPAPNLAPLTVKPKLRKVRPGSKVKFKVRVKNSGMGTARAVKLCLKAPKKMVRSKKKCVLLGDLAPGQISSRTFRVKLTGKARRGKRVALKFTASAGHGQTVKARGRIKVR